MEKNLKKDIFMCVHCYVYHVTELLCCTPETNTVNQLYFN